MWLTVHNDVSSGMGVFGILNPNVVNAADGIDTVSWAPAEDGVVYTSPLYSIANEIDFVLCTDGSGGVRLVNPDAPFLSDSVYRELHSGSDKVEFPPGGAADVRTQIESGNGTWVAHQPGRTGRLWSFDEMSLLSTGIPYLDLGVLSSDDGAPQTIAYAGNERWFAFNRRDGGPGEQNKLIVRRFDLAPHVTNYREEGESSHASSNSTILTAAGYGGDVSAITGEPSKWLWLIQEKSEDGSKDLLNLYEVDPDNVGNMTLIGAMPSSVYAADGSTPPITGLVWVPDIRPVPERRNVKIAWILDIPSSNRRFCTLDTASFNYDGHAYVGRVGMQVSGVSMSLSSAPPVSGVSVNIASEEERTYWASEPGHKPAELSLLRYVPSTGMWVREIFVPGRMSKPVINLNRVDFNVEPPRVSDKAIEPVSWSPDMQIARYPLDVGFSELPWIRANPDPNWLS